VPIYIDPTVTVPYVFEADRKKDNPPKFLTRVFDNGEQDEVQEWIFAVQSEENAAGSVSLSSRIVAKGWCGVEDWNDPEGKAYRVDFDDAGKPTPQAMGCMSMTDKVELMSAILANIGLSTKDQD
jgi:hypothetical protein